MGLLTNRKVRNQASSRSDAVDGDGAGGDGVSSYETKAIDRWYSALIQHDAKTLPSISIARSHTMRFGLYLYEEDGAEPARIKRQSIDVELDKVWRDYRARIRSRYSRVPSARREIQAVSALFDKAVADAQQLLVFCIYSLSIY